MKLIKIIGLVFFYILICLNSVHSTEYIIENFDGKSCTDAASNTWSWDDNANFTEIITGSTWCYATASSNRGRIVASGDSVHNTNQITRYSNKTVGEIDYIFFDVIDLLQGGTGYAHTTRHIDWRVGTVQLIKLAYNSGGLEDWDLITPGHYEIRFDDTNASVYLNNTYLKSATINPNDYFEFQHQAPITAGQNLLLIVDDFGYGLGASIETNLNEYYNSSNISIQLNTISNVNMSYILDNGTKTTICLNCNNYILNLSELSEGLHNITFISDDGPIQSNTSANFTIDTIIPILYFSLPVEYNYYDNFNLSSYINVTEINLDTCLVDIIYNSNIEKTVNCTNESIDFNYNGYYTFNVTVKDLANNTATDSDFMLVDPFGYVYFYNVEDSDYIYNFTINDTLYENYFEFNIYDYGLGNHTFLFEKDGYQSGTFNLSLVNNSKINVTINFLKSRIIINLYDDSTKQLITNESFEMQLSGVLGYLFNTTSSPFNLSNGIAASDYVALISSTNYESKEVYFTYTNQEIKELNVYFIPLNLTNLGFVTIEAYKADNTPAKYITTYAKQWFPLESAFIKVQETKTGNDGTAELKIILEDHIYQFCIYTDEGGETCTGEEIIKTTENGQIIPITEEKRIITQQSYSDLLDFSENITVLISNITGYRNLYVNFDWVDLTGFDLEMCYTIKKDYLYTKTLVESACLSGSAGSFEQIYLLNSSYAYIVDIYAIVDNTNLPMYHNTFKSEEPSESASGVLENKGMTGLSLVLYIVIVMTIIALLKDPMKGIVVLVIAILGANWFFNELMSAYALSALITFCGMTAWGLRQIK